MLDELLQLLEGLAKRPSMYVNPVEVATVQSYLHGLEAGCSMAGLRVSREAYAEAAKARGWKLRAMGIVWQMREQGLVEGEIIAELIAVQMDAFRLCEQ